MAQPHSWYPIRNGLAPPMPPDGPGPREITIFVGEGVTLLDGDFALENGDGSDTIQSVWIENQLNANPLSIYFPVTQQLIVVPAGLQAMYPVFASSPCSYHITTLAGGGAKLVFLNVPMPYAIYGANNPSVSLVPIVGNYTDRSIAAATGASQQLMAANAARQAFLIGNPVANANPCYVNFGAAATATGDSLEILPGGILKSQDLIVNGQQINVIATAGQSVTAKEM